MKVWKEKVEFLQQQPLVADSVGWRQDEQNRNDILFKLLRKNIPSSTHQIQKQKPQSPQLPFINQFTHIKTQSNAVFNPREIFAQQRGFRKQQKKKLESRSKHSSKQQQFRQKYWNGSIDPKQIKCEEISNIKQKIETLKTLKSETEIKEQFTQTIITDNTKSRNVIRQIESSIEKQKQKNSKKKFVQKKNPDDFKKFMIPQRNQKYLNRKVIKTKQVKFQHKPLTRIQSLQKYQRLETYQKSQTPLQKKSHNKLQSAYLDTLYSFKPKNSPQINIEKIIMKPQPSLNQYLNPLSFQFNDEKIFEGLLKNSNLTNKSLSYNSGLLESYQRLVKNKIL